MKRILTALVAAATLSLGGMALAGPIELTPANPQPTSLKKGLSVKYHTGTRQIRTLGAAISPLKSAKPGQPLPGLTYPDKGKGAKVLTTDRSELVAADIRGYIRFDAPGQYVLDFYANDGLKMIIGGQTVAVIEGIGPCRGAKPATVKVPTAGWYPLRAIYFQKEGTACLESEWSKAGGSPTAIPNSAFGH